jgi:hypothetical protein
MKWKLSHFSSFQYTPNSQIKVKAVVESLQGLRGAGVKVMTIVLDIHGEETRSILDHADMQTPESFCKFIQDAFGLLAPVAVSELFLHCSFDICLCKFHFLLYII